MAGVTNLTVVDGMINAAKDCAMLEENLLPSIEKCFGDRNAPFIFQHDIASPHAARYTIISIQLCQVQRIRWLSQSPDLYPIENVWGHIEQKFKENPPRNKAELITKVFEIWENVGRLYIQRVYQSIPARLETGKKCHGHVTKY